MNSSLEETSYSCLFQRRVPLKFFATLARTCRRGMQHSKLELVSKRNKFQLELVSSRDEFHLKSRKISPHLKTLSLSLTLSVSLLYVAPSPPLGLGLGQDFRKLIFCSWWVCSCVCEIVVGLGCCLDCDCDCDFCFDFVFGLLLVFVESFGCTVNVSHSKSIQLLRKSGKERKILV